jgi:hypothetical protein
MRIAVGAVVALIAGFVLGGWGPKTENLELRQRVVQLEEQLEHRTMRAPVALAGVRRMLNVPDWSPVQEPAAATPPQAVERPRDAGSPELDSPDNGGLAYDASGNGAAVKELEKKEDETEERAARSIREHIERASEVWALRSGIARDTFLHKVEADQAQSIRFDVLVEAMNIRLEATIRNWSAAIQEETVPPAEVYLRMMNELTDSLVLTYDELDRNMPETWREAVGTDFRLINHIDPYVALPLVNIEQQMRSIHTE